MTYISDHKTIYLLQVDTSVPYECSCSETVMITDNKTLAESWASHNSGNFTFEEIVLNQTIDLAHWGFGRSETKHVKAFLGLLEEYNDKV